MPTCDLAACYEPASTPLAMFMTGGPDACWGAALTGCAAGCTPGFLPGKAHFKTKFCKACQKSLRVPVERVRALTATELEGFVNRRSEGFWNAEASGVLRVVNNTAMCVEPALAVYRDELPAEARAGWSPLPAHWVDSEGCVLFCVSKGTLVPAASLRGGQLYGDRQLDSGRPQKRQRLDPRAVFARHASDSEPVAASPVDSPSNESMGYLDVMAAVPVQEPPAKASALLEHMIAPNEVTEALGSVASTPPCTPPVQRAAAPPCATPPLPGYCGAASWFQPPAFVSSAQGAAPPPKTTMCAAALAAAGFPPLPVAQQVPQPQTLLPEEQLAPALSSALKAVGALLGATLDQAQLSAQQQHFLRVQCRQFQESSHAFHHFWRQPSQLEEHAMQVEARLGLYCLA